MNLNKMRFVVIDDDATARNTVVDFLRGAGCEDITECATGEEGLEVIQTNSVDFVISDWEMPGMDGLELIKKVRALPQHKDLPFIIITSPISNENIKVMDAGENGVDAYLIKPFRARVLREKISEVLYIHAEKSKKAVILCDDDEHVRNFVAEVLRDMDFNPVHEFNKATEAYPFLEKNHENIALIVSDWEMPEMTGIEFLHKVRINRNTSQMPFIIITSQTSIEAMKVRKAIDADVDSYLMKPFKVEALQTKVKLVLAKTKLSIAITRALESANAAIADSDWNDAEKHFKHARSLDPKSIDALLGLASLEVKREPKKYDEAMKYIRKAIEINPRYDRPHIELALVYESSSSIEKAIVTLRDALLKCTPQDQVHYHLGRVLLRRGKTDEALLHLDKALELNPKLAIAQELKSTAIKQKDTLSKKKK